MFALTLALALTAAPAPCASPYTIQRGAHRLPVCTKAQQAATTQAWLAGQMALMRAQAMSAAMDERPVVSPSVLNVAQNVEGGPQTYRVHVNGDAYSVTVME